MAQIDATRRLRLPDPVDMTDSALMAARHGLKVFPVDAVTGHPALSEGVGGASNDEQVVAGWWRDGPAWNVGVVLGATQAGSPGFDVLRVHPRAGLTGSERARMLESRGLLAGWSLVTRFPDSTVEVFFPAGRPQTPFRFDQAGVELLSGPAQWVLAPKSAVPGGRVELAGKGQNPPRPVDGVAVARFAALMDSEPRVPPADDMPRSALFEAWRFWQATLADETGRWARDYLESRGFEDMAAGVAPKRPDDLIRFLSRRGFALDDMMAAGIVYQVGGGRWVDRFQDRLVMPILDQDGYVAGVTGRANPANPHLKAKYLNSPTSGIFQKGELLYGLTTASAAKLTRQARGIPVIVEGPFDAEAVRVASEHRPDSDLPEMVGVAPCGTALTACQLARLTQISGGLRQVVFAFDGDRAGQHATARAAEELLTGRQRSWAQVCDAPPDGGKDPAEWLARLGGDRLYGHLFAAPSYPNRIVDMLIEAAGAEPYLEQRLGYWRTAIRQLGQLEFPAAAASFERLTAGLERFTEHDSIIYEGQRMLNEVHQASRPATPGLATPDAGSPAEDSPSTPQPVPLPASPPAAPVHTPAASI
jgi:DNA primase catalytic core